MSIDSRPPRDAMRFSPPRTVTRPDISLVAENLYCVLSVNETMGFVDQVGSVFVAHSGSDLAHAVEVGQSLSWDEAVRMVMRAYGAHRGSMERGA